MFTPIRKCVLVGCLIGLALTLLACGGGPPTQETKSYTIGVLVQSPGMVAFYDGFKAGMTELDYIEGQNVVYVYDGPTNTIEALTPAAESLKGKQLNLLFTVGTAPTQAAKEVFAGTNLPILFAPVVNPVEVGVVGNRRQPGENITGVDPPDTTGKALEWLLKLVPEVKRLYVPHYPQDDAAAQSLQALSDAAATLGLELVIAEAATPEELDTIARTLPDEVDAVFVLRSGIIIARVGDMVKAANERRIPVVTSYIGSTIEAGALVGYGVGFFEMGQQAARMADQILQGANPGTLPVENAELYLGINLQTAAAIGIEISEEILSQAKQIVRPPAP